MRHNLLNSSKPLLLIIICFIFIGCPSSRSSKFKEINDTTSFYNNSIITYKNDSIEVNLNYIHFFGNSKNNGIFGGLKFLSKKTINPNDFKIKITSKVADTIYADTLPNKYLRSSLLKHPTTGRILDTLNLVFFKKNTGKISERKLKNDTITVYINNDNYRFVLAKPN